MELNKELGKWLLDISCLESQQNLLLIEYQ